MLPALRFIWLDLLHDRNRALLSVLGLAVVVFSFVILASLAESIASHLDNITQTYNLIIIRADIFDPAEDRLDPQVIEAARALIGPQVERISPVVFRHTRLNGRIAQLRSAEMQDWQPVFHLRLVSGNWPSHPAEILLGEGLAHAHALTVGDSVEIFGRNFSISGIFRAPGASFASVWMPLEAAWELFGTERGYQAIFVQVAADADLVGVKSQLENDPRLKNNYAVYLENNYTRQYFERAKGFRDLMQIASLLSLVGIIFGVGNTTMLGIIERSHDLGILRAVGFSPHVLTRLIWARTLLISLFAFALGVGLAGVYVSAQQMLTPFSVLGLPLSLKITPTIVISGLTWVVILSVAGSWFATLGFSKRHVIELIRTQ
jgi:putative ABC transport system permease protein